MISGIDEALILSEGVERPLETAIVEESVALASFYEALAGVTAVFKTDIVTVLSMEIPSEAAGDND